MSCKTEITVKLEEKKPLTVRLAPCAVEPTKPEPIDLPTLADLKTHYLIARL
ncbi:hypothetical protein [Neisseria uirgultaei]|uniref:hypothetical protein n=1 Tax=Neisseria uirgultaei TaxID=2830646 RepID=UPI00272D3654|nr:hypothetical protein [Neisseria uirgultaei]